MGGRTTAAREERAAMALSELTASIIHAIGWQAIVHVIDKSPKLQSRILARINAELDKAKTGKADQR